MSSLPDRLPPYSSEAESAALGCIMLDPQTAMEEFILRVKSGRSVFYDVRHQVIFDAQFNLFLDHHPIDVVSIINELKRTKTLDESGGLGYIGSLPDAAPSAANIEYYTDILNEKFAQRQILQVCARYTIAAQEGTDGLESLLSRFETEALNVRQAVEQGRDLADLGMIQKQNMADYEEAITGKKRPGIATGFEEVDVIVGGFKPQDLVLVGASPSAGKTALVLNIMENAILEQSVKVGVISLETSAKKLLHRVNSSVCQVDGSAFMRGTATQEQINKLIRSMRKDGQMHDIISNLFVSDRGGLSIGQAAGIFRVMFKKGARLFILDYLQLLNSGRNNNARRVEEMTLVSTGLKAIAKDLNCPLIVVSSISRDSEKENRPPRLSDLRDSGQLEFDADVCILLHRKNGNDDQRTINVNVAKNKEGRIGETELIFVPNQMRFYSPKRINDKDLPPERKLL